MLALSVVLMLLSLGGSTSLGARSEADAGAAYLRAGGVPADRIRTEDRSRHTLENLLQYRERFQTHTADQPLLVTSRFHLAPSSLLDVGLGIAHTLCTAEDGRLAMLRDLPRMLNEALLIHWYAIGRSFARLPGNNTSPRASASPLSIGDAERRGDPSTTADGRRA